MVAGNTVGSGQQTLCTDGKSQCLSVISFVYSALLDVGVWPNSPEVKQRRGQFPGKDLAPLLGSSVDPKAVDADPFLIGKIN